MNKSLNEQFLEKEFEFILYLHKELDRLEKSMLRTIIMQRIINIFTVLLSGTGWVYWLFFLPFSIKKSMGFPASVIIGISIGVGFGHLVGCTFVEWRRANSQKVEMKREKAQREEWEKEHKEQLLKIKTEVKEL